MITFQQQTQLKVRAFCHNNRCTLWLIVYHCHCQSLVFYSFVLIVHFWCTYIASQGLWRPVFWITWVEFDHHVRTAVLLILLGVQTIGKPFTYLHVALIPLGLVDSVWNHHNVKTGAVYLTCHGLILGFMLSVYELLLFKLRPTATNCVLDDSRVGLFLGFDFLSETG